MLWLIIFCGTSTLSKIRTSKSITCRLTCKARWPLTARRAPRAEGAPRAGLVLRGGSGTLPHVGSLVSFPVAASGAVDGLPPCALLPTPA